MSLLVMAAWLFASADARADVQRRMYLPNGSGIAVYETAAGGLVNGIVSTTSGVVAFSPNGLLMYAVDKGSGDVRVYDLLTDTLVDSWTPGLSDPMSMVVTPDGQKAYVTLNGQYGVFAIDLTTRAINVVQGEPGPLAMSPDGAWVYVGAPSDLYRIATVNDAFNVLPAPSPAYTAVTPSGLAITPDGRKAVITVSNQVLILDLTTFMYSARSFGQDLRNVAITPDGTTALIANYGSGEVFFLDLSTMSVEVMAADLSSLTQLGTIDIEPSGKLAWAFDKSTDQLVKIDIATRTATLLPAFGGEETNGPFIGKPILILPSVEIFTSDADFTALGFGNEVIVADWIGATFSGTFTTPRTFRAVGASTPVFSITGGNTVTFSGQILGDSEMLLVGGGTMIVSGASTVPVVQVSNAILQVDGTADGVIKMLSASVLFGTGTVNDVEVSAGATVMPGGNSPGILTAHDVTFTAGALNLQLNGATPGTGYDQLAADSVTMSGPVVLVVTLGPGYAPAPGQVFKFRTNRSGMGSFSGLANNATVQLGAYASILHYDGGDGNDATLTIHSAPTASALSDDAIDEDGTYNGSFTISDDLLAPAALVVTATSSNTALVPNANVVLGGLGGTRTLAITPVAEASGTTTITVRVADDNFYTDETFVLTVNTVNDAPTAGTIAPQTTAEDTALPPVAFTVGDIDNAPASLIVTATSSDQSIVPNANLVAGGSGVNRTIAATPAADAHGVVTITVRVSDGVGHVDRTFQLTVTPENDAPTIGAIGDQTIDQDSQLNGLPFTVADVDGFADVTVSASSSNQTLVPDANLTIGGTGGARTLTIVPAAGQHGTATITVTVDDGTAQATTAFVLTVNEAPSTAITYYLAEGATGPFFDTDILLANPNAQAAPITLTWLLEGGATVNDSRVLAPMSRTTIRVDEVPGLESAAFSTIVTSTEGHAIAVERTMRWGDGGYGSATEKATEGAASTWYFAEGSTGFFSTFLLLANPQATSNTAHVTWLIEGEPAVSRSYPLLPNSRTTIDAGADGALRYRSFGAKVVFDQPGVAERTMYFGASPVWSGGAGAAGSTRLSGLWNFAEGATGSYFTTFLLLANPGETAATVTLTFFPEGGTPVSTTHTLAAGQRMTRNVAEEDPSLLNVSVATKVESTEPIVAERAQYWGQPAWIESHDSFGVIDAGRKWALAEGRVGGADGAQTYILLANPGDTAGTATLTFLRTDGTTVVKTVDVPAASRVTVGVTGPGSAVPELTNETFGTLIESTRPIVVERSLYSNANGITWAAGANATATKLPEPR